ncbi:hypothetical protein [Bacillus marinisedimentorum]|uniref:hypothetical protein n=1 Tax=Bacillus marinisedimentorum TaxID=1821260 RepID=UPI0012FF90CA|nr:hypothetical protein [Bacillus marinisedimentorum]
MKFRIKLYGAKYELYGVKPTKRRETFDVRHEKKEVWRDNQLVRREFKELPRETTNQPIRQ